MKLVGLTILIGAMAGGPSFGQQDDSYCADSWDVCQKNGVCADIGICYLFPDETCTDITAHYWYKGSNGSYVQTAVAQYYRGCQKLLDEPDGCTVVVDNTQCKSCSICDEHSIQANCSNVQKDLVTDGCHSLGNVDKLLFDTNMAECRIRKESCLLSSDCCDALTCSKKGTCKRCKKFKKRCKNDNQCCPGLACTKVGGGSSTTKRGRCRRA